MENEFRDISINKIEVLENVRTRIKDIELAELMQSIKQHGLLQPIGVWETPDKEFALAYGHRRLEACKKLGWTTIQAKILGEMTTEEFLIINTTENLHRKEVTLAELGRICYLLKTKGLAVSEIASNLSVLKSRVDAALHACGKIPKEHINDVVFMAAGEKFKKGKIPATLYNYILQTQRELKVSPNTIKELLKVVKTEEISMSKLRVITSLLQNGMSITEAIKKSDEYIIRRISLPFNKVKERQILKENNLEGVTGKFSKLFTKICNGKIEGMKGWVYEA